MFDLETTIDTEHVTNALTVATHAAADQVLSPHD